MSRRAVDPAGPAGSLTIKAPEPARQAVYLHSGQVFASAAPSRVTTILGSCVAACVWNPESGIGGLTHFPLPHWAGGGAASTRFGNVAIAALLRDLARLGAESTGLRARLVGGACVLLAFRDSGRHLGLENVDLAKRMLAERRIPVVGCHVGGPRGRRLVFHTDTGESRVTLL